MTDKVLEMIRAEQKGGNRISGIYIPGMEMPTSCNACMFDVNGLCLINKYLEAKDELTHSCPLVPVPPHGRTIDADFAIANRNKDFNWCYDLTDLPNYLKELPTIIPADIPADKDIDN